MPPTREGDRQMTRTNLSVAVLTSAALLLAGCGGGSSSPGVAHLSNTSAGSAADGAEKSSSPESGGKTQQKMVAYSQCMRSHGVPEFPEPTEGHILIHSSDHNGQVTGVNPRSAQFQAAQKVCAKLLPNGGAPSPAQQAKIQEGALKFSQCMRTHGVPNFPDPNFTGGGVQLTIHKTGDGIDPNSPQFKSAQKTCQSSLPKPLGANSPGPGGGEVSSSGGGSEQGPSEAIVP
jgi:hypothetical protein